MLGSLEPPFIHQQRAATYTYIQKHVLADVDWPELVTLLDSQRNRQERVIVAAYQAVLPALACTAVGGQAEAATPVSAAWLLLALAAQIFDDVQDQDKDKKERPWRIWPLRKVIPTGLGLIFAAQSCLVGLKTSPQAATNIQTLINQSCLQAAQGQTIPPALTLESYFQDAITKSGLLLAAVCQAGACVHTSETAMLQNIYDFGLSLGILMQIFDDLADLSPSEPDNDLAQGRYTLPVIYALSQTDHPLQPQLQALIHPEQPAAVNTAESAGRIFQLLVEMNALAATLSLAAVYKDKALTQLKSFPPDNVIHLQTYLSYYNMAL